MKIRAIAIVFLFGIVQNAWATQSPSSFPLPMGWRLATLKDVVKDGEIDPNNRKENPTYYLQATGDFDGNGLQDTARMLINNKKKAAIYITMHNSDGTFKHIRFGSEGNISDTYIENAPPATYQNIDFAEGDHTQVPSVTTTHDGFAYGRFESTQTIVYWDEKTHYFKTIPTGD